MDFCEYTHPVGVPQQRSAALLVCALLESPALSSSLADVSADPPVRSRPRGFPSTAQSGEVPPAFGVRPCLFALHSARCCVRSARFAAQHHNGRRSR